MPTVGGMASSLRVIALLPGNNPYSSSESNQNRSCGLLVMLNFSGYLL